LIESSKKFGAALIPANATMVKILNRMEYHLATAINLINYINNFSVFLSLYFSEKSFQIFRSLLQTKWNRIGDIEMMLFRST